MPASARTPCCTAAQPPTPDDSSSVLLQKTTSPRSRTPARRSASTANARVVTPPFMSHEPRPYSLPSRTSARKGSEAHSSRGPVATASTCPLSSRLRPAAGAARAAPPAEAGRRSRARRRRRGARVRSAPAPRAPSRRPSARSRRSRMRWSLSSSRGGSPGSLRGRVAGDELTGERDELVTRLAHDGDDALFQVGSKGQRDLQELVAPRGRGG